MIAVPFQRAINARQQAKTAEVKLTLMDEQWIVDVLLDYKSAIFSFIRSGSANYTLDFSDGFDHSDALATICVFSRLDNPSILRGSVLLPDLINGVLVIFVHFGVVIVVVRFFVLGVLFVGIILLDCSSDLLVRLLGSLLDSVEVLDEFVVVWIVDSLRGVESQG